MILNCLNIKKLDRFNEIKTFTCLELPVKFIHKPIGEWMCKACALNIVNGSRD